MMCAFMGKRGNEERTAADTGNETGTVAGKSCRNFTLKI